MKRKATQFHLDLEWLSSSAQGRRVLHHLIVKAGCLSPPAPGNDFLAGRESLGHEFLGPLASVWPDRLASLLTENRPVQHDHGSDDRDGYGDDGDDDSGR